MSSLLGSYPDSILFVAQRATCFHPRGKTTGYSTGKINKLHRQLQLIQNKNLYPHMDLTALERIVNQELLPYISNGVSEILKEQEETSRKLRAKLNQLSFGNDSERDKRIVELFNQGLSRGKIAKEVVMSKWGVSKALRRLSQLG